MWGGSLWCKSIIPRHVTGPLGMAGFFYISFIANIKWHWRVQSTVLHLGLMILVSVWVTLSIYKMSIHYITIHFLPMNPPLWVLNHGFSIQRPLQHTLNDYSLYEVVVTLVIVQLLWRIVNTISLSLMSETNLDVWRNDDYKNKNKYD